MRIQFRNLCVVVAHGLIDTTSSGYAQGSIRVCSIRRTERKIAAVDICEEHSDGRESQAKVLGMGLRRSGTDSRTAEAHGRADGQAIRARAARDRATAARERTQSARAPRQAARRARSNLHDRAARARGTYLRQGLT